jgi:hypothetical protein
MNCIVDARDDALAARDALLAHPALRGGTLTSPREDPTNCWTLELQIVTDDAVHRHIDGWEPHHARTAAEHGLTVREVKRRSPAEVRVLLTA